MDMYLSEWIFTLFLSEVVPGDAAEGGIGVTGADDIYFF